MMVLLVTLWQLAKARRRWIGRRTDLANMVTAFSLSVVTYMTTGIFLHLSYARYFWLIMALAGAAAYIALHEPDPGDGGRVRDRPADVPSRVRDDVLAASGRAGRRGRLRLAVAGARDRAPRRRLRLARLVGRPASRTRVPPETDGPVPSPASPACPGSGMSTS